jgi:hypothetical protein
MVTVHLGYKHLVAFLLIMLPVSAFSGYVYGHILHPPDPITGTNADNITKYCHRVTSADINQIPEPFRSFVKSYINSTGIYDVYICRSGTPN